MPFWELQGSVAPGREAKEVRLWICVSTRCQWLQSSVTQSLSLSLSLSHMKPFQPFRDNKKENYIFYKQVLSFLHSGCLTFFVKSGLKLEQRIKCWAKFLGNSTGTVIIRSGRTKGGIYTKVAFGIYGWARECRRWAPFWVTGNFPNREKCSKIKDSSLDRNNVWT